MPARQNLKIYREALVGFCRIYHPDGLNILLSQGFVLGSSHCGNDRQRVHSEDRGGSEEPLTALVQFEGQLAITSS